VIGMISGLRKSLRGLDLDLASRVEEKGGVTWFVGLGEFWVSGKDRERCGDDDDDGWGRDR